MKESLLIKYINGECTPEETAKVIEWLDQPGAREQLNAIFEKHWEKEQLDLPDQTDYDQLLVRIHRKINFQKDRQRRSWGKTLRLAASYAMILFCVVLLREGILYSKKHPKENQKVAVQNIVRTTGSGEKLSLRLSDGTMITVNADSEIAFTIPLGTDERGIHLKGEAFFDIAEDTLRPFRVYTDELTTTALGTQFNVFARENTFRVALTEGKVKVGVKKEGVELVPGQMAIWEAKEEKSLPLSITVFDKEKVTAWKEGKLVFDRRPLGLILDDLAKWYSVDMQIGDAVDKKRKVTGTFQNKNLKDILAGLSFSIGFEYQISDKKVTIK